MLSSLSGVFQSSWWLAPKSPKPSACRCYPHAVCAPNAQASNNVIECGGGIHSAAALRFCSVVSFDGWRPRWRLLTNFFGGIMAGGEDVRVERRR